MGRPPTILVISQTYPPDHAAVGQHMHEVAAELVRRGYRVVTYASARGYDDPAERYARRETRDGVEIRRMPLSSFGKRTIAIRLLGGLIFCKLVALRALFTRGLAGILVSTSPPTASTAAVFIGKLRRVPITHWVMDLNPDQMVELGKIDERSLPARIFDFLNRLIFRNASRVIVLDRFMAQRVLRKLDIADKLRIIPPAAHGDQLESIPHAENPFRQQYGLEGKFVVMYSGNHALTNPVDTIVEAALRLQDREKIVFFFIGGGVGKQVVDRAIEQHAPPNIVSLPYQPLERIKYSISAADVHLVTLGSKVAGVVHPCKAYDAMLVGKPILLLGPDPCHVSDILAEHDVGWRVDHGQVDEAVKLIEQIAATPPEELEQMGRRAVALMHDKFAWQRLQSEVCDTILEPIGTPATAVSE
jgi:glycosyltransferase involved in cell wall biosynthesis